MNYHHKYAKRGVLIDTCDFIQVGHKVSGWRYAELLDTYRGTPLYKDGYFMIQDKYDFIKNKPSWGRR